MTESQDDEAIILPSLMSYRDLARHDFVPPPAGAIEIRAVRRRRRKIVTSAALSVALIGVSTILLVAHAVPPMGGDQIGGTSPPTASPSQARASSPTPPAPPAPGATSLPTEIPVTVMLTGYDIWEGGGMLIDGDVSGDWALAASLATYCNPEKPLTYPASQFARHEVRDRTIKKAGVEVVQRVELADEPNQQSLMQWYRDLINSCAASIGQATGARPEIIAEGFAGQESFIVGRGGNFWAMVRQGAFTSQILFKSGETLSEMRSAAVKAALRMSRAA